jgi:hypothetical protein
MRPRDKSPRGALARVLMWDQIHSSGAYYERGEGTFVIPEAGATPRPWRSSNLNLGFFRFDRHKTARAENKDVLALLRTTFGRDNMVRLKKDYDLTDFLEALHMAMTAIECHDLTVDSMIAHPSAWEKISGFYDWKITTNRIYKFSGARDFAARLSIGGRKAKTGHAYPSFELDMIFSPDVPRNTMILTAPPDYVGVWTDMEDDLVGMALINGYAVSRILIG